MKKVSEIAKDYYDNEPYKGYKTYSDWKWFRKPNTISQYNQTKYVIENILSTLSIKSKKALEIGGGDGVWTELLLKRNFKVDLVDISENMLSMAKKRLKNKVNYFLGDFTKIDIKRKYDLFYLIRCFEYIDNKKKAIKKMFSIGKGKCKIIIVTKNPLFLSIKFQDRKLHSKQIKINDLKNMLEKGGFKVLKIVPAVIGKGNHFSICRKFNEYLNKKELNYNNFFVKYLTESFLIFAEK